MGGSSAAALASSSPPPFLQTCVRDPSPSTSCHARGVASGGRIHATPRQAPKAAAASRSASEGKAEGSEGRGSREMEGPAPPPTRSPRRTAAASAKPKSVCGPEPPTWPQATKPPSPPLSPPPSPPPPPPEAPLSLSLSLSEERDDGAKTVSSTMNVYAARSIGEEASGAEELGRAATAAKEEK